MTEKHGSPIESLGDDRKKGFEDSEKRRGQGAKDLEKKGFKEPRIWKRKGSRIRGFEGSSGERQKTEYRSQEAGGRRRLEGWKVRGLATPLHFQTSNLLKKGLAKKLKGEE